MATLKLSLIFFPFLCALITSVVVVSGSKSDNTSLIRAGCETTTFSELCIKSIKPQASIIGDDRKALARVGLQTALSRATSAKAFLFKMNKNMQDLTPDDHKNLRSCGKMLRSSIAHLKGSLSYLEVAGTHAGSTNKLNTWITDAMSDVQSCKDLMADHQSLTSNVRVAVKARTSYVSQIIANSIGLCNYFDQFNGI